MIFIWSLKIYPPCAYILQTTSHVIYLFSAFIKIKKERKYYYEFTRNII